MASPGYEPSALHKHSNVASLSKHLPAPQVAAEATVVLATVDPDIRANMSALLENYNVKAVWITGLEELGLALSTETVLACFCGFWLVDGTYRDVVRQLRRQPVEIPAIVVCAPGCSEEYRDYLAALNIRAFDYLCHPYRKADLERILHSAISVRHPVTRSGNALLKTAGPAMDKLRTL